MRFPFSITLIVVIVYLSLFTPPKIEIVENILGFDKLVHAGMYLGLALIIKWELFGHPRTIAAWRNAPKVNKYALLWLTLILPMVIGSVMELVQAHLTNNRGGDLYDGIANIVGVGISYFIFRQTANTTNNKNYVRTT